ncbi:MAG TPA: glycosyltransferase [Acidimicrobiales bacterium]|nr:glycosyltransferase [Acidimicrobiales bacterium]
MATRVLVLSFDPVTESMAGPAIRAWQLAQVLDTRFDVTLASTVEATLRHDSMEVCSVARQPGGMAHLVDKADVVFAPTSVVRRHREVASSPVPLVIDMYIPTHLENLERGGRGDTEYAQAVSHQVSVINEDLARGDFFLCASERQRDFWLGALSHAGRVNPATYDDDPTLRRLIDVVAFGLPPDPPVPAGPVLRRHFPAIGAADPVVVWGGGVYDWFDPVSLVRAVHQVRRRVPDVRLVFLGMNNPNPDIAEMARALELRAVSDELGLTGSTVFFNDRWVPYLDWGSYLLDADVAVSIHLDNLETRFSFRTRILDYLWARRPMILTGGDSLGDLVAAQGLGITVAPGDVDAIEAALVRLLSDGLPLADFGPTLARFQWPEVARPLLRWLESARRSPDTGTPDAGALEAR